VTAASPGLGGRLPLVDPATLTGASRELFAHMQESVVPWAQRNGFAATTDDGRLIGPFNATLLNPRIAAEFLKLQAAEEKSTSVDQRVRQVVILTVGAVWQAPYELCAHSAVARHAGLGEPDVAALAEGRPPGAARHDIECQARITRKCGGRKSFHVLHMNTRWVVAGQITAPRQRRAPTLMLG
jgi:4-carboxymuconolactone decarboxylase